MRTDTAYTIIVRWSDEDRAWLAECPALKPCIADGITPGEAVSVLSTLIDMQEQFVAEREG